LNHKCRAETVEPKPLRRFITPLQGVFDQTFFEKVCDQAFFEKVCETRAAEPQFCWLNSVGGIFNI
jgi:hypothetical protein